MDLIELIKYILLGLIQGITEPLPISSSGHLVIFEEIFHIGISDLNFEIFVNAGSLVAILIIYRKFLMKLIGNTMMYIFQGKKEFKSDYHYSLLIVLGVIPAGLIGFLFKDSIELYLKNLMVVGITLLITATALSLTNKYVNHIDGKTEINALDAFIIGLFQVVALIPGISRSGSTMVGGLSRKINFEETMRFSFMLYIPISLAALLLGILDVETSNVFIPGYIGGFIVSVIGTYFAVKLLFNVVNRGNLKYFSYYCYVVGALVLGYSLIEVIL